MICVVGSPQTISCLNAYGRNSSRPAVIYYFADSLRQGLELLAVPLKYLPVSE